MRRARRFHDRRNGRGSAKRILYAAAAALLLLSSALLIRYLLHAQQARTALEEARSAYNAPPAETAPGPAAPPDSQTTLDTPDIGSQSAGLTVDSRPDERSRRMLPANSFHGKQGRGRLVAPRRPGRFDYPVAKGHQYYMNHDFYGREPLGLGVPGPVQLHQAPGANLILHGHNMKNGSMFESSRYLTSTS